MLKILNNKKFGVTITNFIFYGLNFVKLQIIVW